MERPVEPKRNLLDALAALRDGQHDSFVVAFVAADYVVRTGDTEVVGDLPSDVRSALEGMVEVYRRDGRVVSLSSTGPADHTAFIRQYVSVVEGVVPAGSFAVAPWGVSIPWDSEL